MYSRSMQKANSDCNGLESYMLVAGRRWLGPCWLRKRASALHAGAGVAFRAFSWRFGKIQLVADCMEEGMRAYNGRDWRSFV